MKRITSVVAVGLFLWSLPPDSRADLIFDVAADYSPTRNPNGVWSYGFKTSLGGSLSLYTDTGVREGLDTWRGNIAGDGNPAVYHNATASTVVLGGTARFDPGQFGLHPGPGGQYSVARWTAPTAGTFTLDSSFVGQDVVGATTDVHVLHNGLSLFDDLIEGAGDTALFGASLTVAQGDMIDFAVGFGRNGSFDNDSTGLAARFTQVVPEPAGVVMLGSGALGLLGYGSRRRRAADA